MKRSTVQLATKPLFSAPRAATHITTPLEQEKDIKVTTVHQTHNSYINITNISKHRSKRIKNEYSRYKNSHPNAIVPCAHFIYPTPANPSVFQVVSAHSHPTTSSPLSQSTSPSFPHPPVLTSSPFFLQRLGSTGSKRVHHRPIPRATLAPTHLSTDYFDSPVVP